MRLVPLPDLDLRAIVCPGRALELSGKRWLNIPTTFPWCTHPDSLAEWRAREKLLPSRAAEMARLGTTCVQHERQGLNSVA